jgi:hypothetical protein
MRQTGPAAAGCCIRPPELRRTSGASWPTRWGIGGSPTGSSLSGSATPRCAGSSSRRMSPRSSTRCWRGGSSGRRSRAPSTRSPPRPSASPVSSTACAATHARRRGVEGLDVRDGLEDTLRLLAHRLEDVAVERLYRPAASHQAVPGELNQVWTNLIGNALDAMGGRGTLTVDRPPDPMRRAGCSWRSSTAVRGSPRPIRSGCSSPTSPPRTAVSSSVWASVSSSVGGSSTVTEARSPCAPPPDGRCSPSPCRPTPDDDHPEAT